VLSQVSKRHKTAKEQPNSEQHQPTILSTTRLREFLEVELPVTHNMDNLADADELDNFTCLPRGFQEWIAS